MRAGLPVILILMAILLASGCIQLPGMHILRNSPDPVIGQWIGGELPTVDLHILLFENQTYISRSFYLSQGERIACGTWSRENDGLIVAQSATGNITSWVYDPTDDSIYQIGLPQRKYYRFKG
jgi:hypothetical protein